MLRTIKVILASLLAVLLGTALALDAENMISAVKKSVDVCLYTIIPSLFGFMIISSFLMKSGLYKIIFKPLYLILRFFIRLSEEEFSILVLSLVGGYPVGAKLISDVCKKNPESTVKNILPFCYCGSSVFIMTIVGINLYGNTEIGLIVYFSNVLGCLVYAVFASLMKKKIKSINIAETKNIIKINQKTITDSVLSASGSLFPVCAMIVFFAVVIQALKFYNIDDIFSFLGSNSKNASSVFFSFLEISNIHTITNKSMDFLPVVAALTSFGGCCIILQIFAITGDVVKLKSFILSRFPIAALSGIICFFLISEIHFSVETITAKNVVLPSETGNPAASAALLAMSVLLMASSYREHNNITTV